MLLLSLVIPCYNESSALPVFMKELTHVIDALDDVETEVLFIDDGSSDDTLCLIKEIAASHSGVRYYSFSRNFGKESAILAGLVHSKGDYVAVMDADLQDPPALLPEMLRAVREGGVDCAGTRRVSRKGEPPIRSFFARMFYRFINAISATQLVDGARDYKLLSRQAVDALISMPEYNRFSKGLYEWIGFRTKWFDFENVERIAGETKWSFWKLFKYSLEGIFAFSTIPLAFSSLLGVIFMLFSVVTIAILLIRESLYHISAYGWTSMVCVILLVSGVQLFCLGIFGQYLAKAYLEVKHRPHFIVKESSGD